jgi:hypothetical protein
MFKIQLSIFLISSAFFLIASSTISRRLVPVSEVSNQFSNMEVDLINITSFDISKTGALPSLKNTLLLNQNEFVKKFGKPQKKLVEYSELDDANMDCYIYKGMKVWFLNQSLESLELTSSNFCLNFLNKKKIIVSENIETIVRTYPKSWQKKRDNQVFIGLKNNQITIDINLIFEYDSTTRKITEIHFGY